MAENGNGGSAGQISLELVIKSRLKEQFDKMCSSVRRPAEELGEAMEEAVSKPLENTAHTVEKVLGEATVKAADKMENIIISIISLLGTLGGSLGGILVSSKLTNYRIEQLEKRVDKHNTVIERTYTLEEQMKAANHRIDELERSERHEK